MNKIGIMHTDCSYLLPNWILSCVEKPTDFDTQYYTLTPHQKTAQFDPVWELTMHYLEKKVINTYHYTCEDVFGTLEINSPDRLNVSQLDSLTLQLMNKPSHTGIVGDISYTLTRINLDQDE